MALKTLESLVLRGWPVAGDVVAGKVRLGSKVDGQAPANLSYPRHLYPRFPQVERAQPREVIDAIDDDAAHAAGRPGNCATGVLVFRNPAKSAGGAVLSGWSPRELLADSSAGRLWLRQRPTAPAGLIKPVRLTSTTPTVSTRGDLARGVLQRPERIRMTMRSKHARAVMPDTASR